MSLLLAVAVTYAFNDAEPVINDKVREAFKKEFANAQLLKWSQQEDFYRATFIYAGLRAVAFFNEEGGLEGAIRTVFYNQLPLAVISAIENNFSEGLVIESAEISNKGGTFYRIIVESHNKRYKMKTDASGNIIEKKRVKNKF